VTPFDLGALTIAVAACVVDVRMSRIPNSLTFTSLAAGVAMHAVAPAGHGLPAAVGGALTGLAIFFPVFALGGMGAGDVKLMAALGAWLGWGPVAWTALYTAIAGGVLALGWGFAQGYLRQAFRNLRSLGTMWLIEGIRPMPSLTLDQGRGPRLPYALPILVGVLVTIWRH
jgi:prepilin peptidase CpaA